MVLQEARRGMYDIVSGSEYYIYGTYIYIYVPTTPKPYIHFVWFLNIARPYFDIFCM